MYLIYLSQLVSVIASQHNIGIVQLSFGLQKIDNSNNQIIN